MRGSFGNDWMSDEVNANYPGSPLPVKPHRIGGLLATPSEPQVSEILELSEYLKRAVFSGAFPDLIVNLKSDYESTLPQLALACRLLRCGVEGLEFEPPTEGGKRGDIEFVLKGVGYLVECYRPGSEARSERNELERLVVDALKSVENRQHPKSVAIKVRGKVGHEDRKALVAAVWRLGKETDNRSEPGFIELAQGEVSVANTEVVPSGGKSLLVLHPDYEVDGDPTIFIRKVSATKRALHVANPDFSGEAESHVALWIPEEPSANEAETEETLEGLITTLRKKLSQIRRTDWRRILVVAGDTVFTLDDEVRTAIKHRVVLRHEGVEAVVFMGRYYDRGSSRHRYQLDAVLAKGDSDIASLVRDLRDQEENSRVPEVV